jgi:arsenate reductase
VLRGAARESGGSSAAGLLGLQSHPPFIFCSPASYHMKKRVLILCTGNSARSQMAEGLLRHDAGDVFDVESAGTKPVTVRPEAIAAMREVGIDISGQRSKHVNEFERQRFDYVITVCDNAKESCPVFIGAAKTLHQSFDDPPWPFVGTDEERMTVFRRVRDELRKYLRKFAQDACVKGKSIS